MELGSHAADRDELGLDQVAEDVSACDHLDELAILAQYRQPDHALSRHLDCDGIRRIILLWPDHGSTHEILGLERLKVLALACRIKQIELCQHIARVDVPYAQRSQLPPLPT
jgi:hypothetical protein